MFSTKRVSAFYFFWGVYFLWKNRGFQGLTRTHKVEYKVSVVGNCGKLWG